MPLRNAPLVDHPGYISSRWYPSMNRAAVGNITLVADRLHSSLLHIRAPVVVRGIGVNVNTGAASSNLKFGIYGLVSGLPVTRLAVGSASVASATSSTFVSVDFTADLVLAQGFYVAALISDGAPSITANTASDYPIAGLTGVVAGQNAVVAGSFITGWHNDAGTYSAGIPTSFGTPTERAVNSPVFAFQVR